MTTSSGIPEVLEALRADLAATERLVVELDDEFDVTHRAELTVELLVRRTALVEDTLERGVFNFLDKRVPVVAEHGRLESARLRQAMVPVDHRIRGIHATDVHRSDPDGFEHDLQEFETTLDDVRSWEVTELYPALESLRPTERSIVQHRVDAARRHASEHPAPGGPVRRVLHKVEAKMDHHIGDRQS